MKGRKSSETMFMNEAEEEKIRKTMSTITKDGESVDDVDKIWQSEVSDWEDVKNPVLRRMAKALVCVRCLPPERTDATTRNVLLRVFQRLSILADLAAACVAILTFNSVSYCCNEPILNFRDMDWPWQKLTKVLVYLYLVLVLCEIYPVVKRGFPFNIVNPFFGFIITVAMFFDDSKAEALLMWCIETFAVVCEYSIYCVKVWERDFIAREVLRVGKLTIPNRTGLVGIEESHVDSQSAHRQEFFRLKLEQKHVKKMLWYLRVACYINLTLVFMVLVVIIFISRAGGLCIDGYSVPNLFDSDQLGRCPACQGIDGLCEVCDAGTRMCYFPYV